MWKRLSKHEMNCINLSKSSPQTCGSSTDQCTFLPKSELHFLPSEPLFYQVPLLPLPVPRRSFQPACSFSPAWLDVHGPDKSLFLLHPEGQRRFWLFCQCHKSYSVTAGSDKARETKKLKDLGRYKVPWGLKAWGLARNSRMVWLEVEVGWAGERKLAMTGKLGIMGLSAKEWFRRIILAYSRDTWSAISLVSCRNRAFATWPKAEKHLRCEAIIVLVILL